MKTIYYAIQNVVNGKGSNVTKVLSLALGLTIGILLFSQIAFELSYDKCWTQWEQLAIVRIKNTVNHQPNERWSPSCEGTMSAALMENFPDKVQSVTSYTTALTNDLYKEDGTLLAPVQMYADSLFFRTLDIPVLEGNPIEDLKMPQSLYISESYAKEIELPLIMKNDYALRPFVRMVAEDIGHRCGKCYEMRFLETARQAAALAAEFTCRVVENTPAPTPFGVEFEKCLPMLCQLA